MKNFLGKHWPLFAAIGVLWAVLAALLIISFRLTEGHFAYSLDDAYIHMAMAKHLVQNGVWGITPYEFSSATSSPLWTFMLSGLYLVFGVREMTPFVLNVVLATMVVATLYYVLYSYGISRSGRFLIPLGIAFVMPLPALVFIGMEAVMQVLLSTLFACLAARELSCKKSGKSSLQFASIVVLAPLVSSIRYEGMFLVLVVSVFFLFRRRWLDAFVVGVFAAIPVIFYAKLSMLYGWHPLPNPVALYGNNVTNLDIKAILAFLYSGHLQILRDIVLMLTITGVLLLLMSKYGDVNPEGRALAIIFVSTSILHMLFSKIGQFYRYEAYLISLGLLALSCIASSRLRVEKKSISIYPALFLIILLLPPVISRGAEALLKTPQSSGNIYDQQYQMGRFLKRFYNGRTVVANDIGAINYLADIKCIDLVGLGSLEVFRMKQQYIYNRFGLQALTRVKSAEIAVIYDQWFTDLLPSDWIKVGQWRISDNYAAAFDTVSLYATDAEKASELSRNLEAFASELPSDVEFQSTHE